MDSFSLSTGYPLFVFLLSVECVLISLVCPYTITNSNWNRRSNEFTSIPRTNNWISRRHPTFPRRRLGYQCQVSGIIPVLQATVEGPEVVDKDELRNFLHNNKPSLQHSDFAEQSKSSSTDTFPSTFTPQHLTAEADLILRTTAAETKFKYNYENMMKKNEKLFQQQSSRRMLFATALIGVAVSFSKDEAHALIETVITTKKSLNPVSSVVDSNNDRDDSKLIWQVTPVNKRTGVTVFDAEQSGYSVTFVTYLSRFLLCFDRNCQKWWFNRAADIPRTATSEQVTTARRQQFAAFSASVEVGLQEYTGPNGPTMFLKALLKRYCPTIDELQRLRELEGEAPLSGTELVKKEREIKEARRQIVLLFALMDKNQPTKELKKQLAAIDNASITRVEVVQRGSGYAPGYGPPEVRFPQPDAGDDGYERATGRAVLNPNGKILRIDVINRGKGYSKPPEVMISSPATIRFQDRDTLAEFSVAKDTTAKAQAFLFRAGPNKGRIERIQLLDPGDLYSANEIIRVQITPPELSRQDGGETATATAVLEYEVSAVQVVKNGTGYAADAPIDVYVEPPPVTARVNMNDPLIVARLGGPPGAALNEWLPALDPRLTKQQQSQAEVFFNKIAFAAGSGGQSGCIGRECYDSPVKAVAYPRAANNKGIFDPFDDDLPQPNSNVNFISFKRSNKKQDSEQQFVSGSSSSGEVPSLLLNVADSSSQFLSLLPPGIGLQFNPSTQQYELAVDPFYKDDRPRWMKTSTTTLVDPDFGPRG